MLDSDFPETLHKRHGSETRFVGDGALWPEPVHPDSSHSTKQMAADCGSCKAEITAKITQAACKLGLGQREF
jgi:hypothetical protein